ncbi:hypothetical protein ACPXB3_05795 [Gordonia sp. DT219]|uniref:hypothetical protein n=1 Tax=Gordonia sp. DT219 TaxID=3416658 RepID=UPI003CE805A4
MTDNVSDAQFEEAVAEAKAEGNLSRANVAGGESSERAVSSTTFWGLVAFNARTWCGEFVFTHPAPL